MRFHVTVRQNGRIVIPKKIRAKLGIKNGSILQVEDVGKDKILITILIK